MLSIRVGANEEDIFANETDIFKAPITPHLPSFLCVLCAGRSLADAAATVASFVFNLLAPDRTFRAPVPRRYTGNIHTIYRHKTGLNLQLNGRRLAIDRRNSHKRTAIDRRETGNRLLLDWLATHCPPYTCKTTANRLVLGRRLAVT